MKEFSARAPLANFEGFEPCSALELLALTLGRMTGAMLTEGTILDIGNDSLSNVSMCAIMAEMGIETTVLGSAPANDGRSTFCAMSDGRIYRFSAVVGRGQKEAGGVPHLCVSAHEAALAETSQDCSITSEYTDGVKGLVGDALREAGLAEENDQINGHVKVNAHAAICMRVCASGRFLVNEGQTTKVKDGYSFKVDCPKPDAEAEEVLMYLTVAHMTEADIKTEQDAQKKSMGLSTPFNVIVGEA